MWMVIPEAITCKQLFHQVMLPVMLLLRINQSDRGVIFGNKELVIAIDGPAGAGKSTIAKMVAEKLG